jgi:hypothetical protein
MNYQSTGARQSGSQRRPSLPRAAIARVVRRYDGSTGRDAEGRLRQAKEPVGYEVRLRAARFVAAEVAPVPDRY